MRLFLDTEFTDFGGDLISLALVSEKDDEFYVVVPYFNSPNLWVHKNVIPVLNIPEIPLVRAQRELQAFLNRFTHIEIIADWPEDFKHFCNFLLTAPGKRITTSDITMRIVNRVGSAGSKIPHNALEDAKAIRTSYFEMLREEGTDAI